MRIGWVSNAPWGQTGYGGQTALFVPRLRDVLKHYLYIQAFWGLQGTTTRWNDITVYPGAKEAYGNDMLPIYAQVENADIVISLIDAWVMQQKSTQQVRWCPLVPVDTEPIAPAVYEALKTAYQVIAYSKYGLAQLQSVGIDALYAPHAVDTKQFQPLPQAEMRETVGLPKDKFVVGIVAANKGNPSRKAFDQQIRGFAKFHAEHPDSHLALHADIWGGWEGENLPRLLQLAGLTPNEVHTPPFADFFAGMLGQDYMSAFYNSLDVFSNCTRGEGFGVPIIEAQACGVPSVVTNFSAMPELVEAGAGWTVDVAEKFFYQDVYQAIPSSDHIAARLSEAYQIWKAQPERWQALKQQARQGMVDNYDADLVVAQHFGPAIDHIQARIDADKQRTEDRRQKREAARALYRGAVSRESEAADK